MTTWVLLCLLYLVLFLCSSLHFCLCFPVLLIKAPITSTSVGVALVAASFEFVNLQEPCDLRRCTCQKGPTLLLGVPHDRRVLWDTSTEDGSSSSRHSARSLCVRRAFWCPSPSPRWPVPACRSACSLGIGSSSLAVGVPVGCSGGTSLSASSKRRLLLLPITSAAEETTEETTSSLVRTFIAGFLVTRPIADAVPERAAGVLCRCNWSQLATCAPHGKVKVEVGQTRSNCLRNNGTFIRRQQQEVHSSQYAKGIGTLRDNCFLMEQVLAQHSPSQ